METCEHWVHKECTRAYLDYEIKVQGKCEVLCFKCNQTPYIRQPDIIELATELWAKLKENYIDQYVKNSEGKAKYCTRPACKGIGILAQNEFKCDSCGWHVCYLCQSPFVFGHLCANLQAINDGLAARYKELAEK